MPTLKVLVPLDGSEKSMHSLNWLKKSFTQKEVEVTLINVTERIYTGETVPLNIEYTANSGGQILDKAEKELAGYKINKLNPWGYSSDVILKEAADGKYDMIVMTKSSVKGISRVIGSVTSKVVRNSEVAVVVIPE
jgi:nucleotide-binding universal stress UspA family protein